MQFFQKMIAALSTLASQLRLVVTEMLKVFKEIGAALKFAYEEIGGFLTTIAKGINSFWHFIFGKFAGLVSYIVYLSSVFGFFLAFEIRYDSKLTKILADLEINVQIAKFLSLPAFLLLVYTLMRILSRQKKHHLIGIALVIALWCGYRGYDYYVKRDYIIDPISEKSIACITAENDKYKIVNCNLKRNGKNRKPVIEITEAVARANAIESGYIIPKKIPVSCNLRFFSIDGDTLLYSHVDEQNLIELSNLPVHHERTNMVYRPVTRDIIARICTEERQQKAKTNQVESAILQIENHALEAENQLLRRQKQEDDSVRLKPVTTSDPKTTPSSEITLLMGGRVVKYSELQPGYVSEPPKQHPQQNVVVPNDNPQPKAKPAVQTNYRNITCIETAGSKLLENLTPAEQATCIREYEEDNHLVCLPNNNQEDWYRISCTKKKRARSTASTTSSPTTIASHRTKQSTQRTEEPDYKNWVKCSEGCELVSGYGRCYDDDRFGGPRSCTFPKNTSSNSDSPAQASTNRPKIHKVKCPRGSEPALWQGPDCCFEQGFIGDAPITCGYPTENIYTEPTVP